MADFSSQVSAAQPLLHTLAASVNRVVQGKEEVVEQVLTALLAGGHLLLEDLPGVGKTTLAYALARSLDCAFSRIQFTSDLLPSDINGVSVFDDASREFVFKPRPIFAQVVLADEINRATPKTQSALLEVMERSQVTVDGHSHPVGPPFMVIATQNPVDFEGTFPLPDSQLDRFLFRLSLGYPETSYELAVLREGRRAYDALAVNPVVSRAELLRWQALVPQVFCEDSVLQFILRLVHATRTENEFRAGVSVRAGLALKQAAQARAFLLGRDFVLPEDVLALASSTLAHRLRLRRASGDPLQEQRSVHAHLQRLMASLPAPS